MHILSLPNALLFLLLLMASTAHPALALVVTLGDDGHPTYAHCKKGDPDVIPRSDFYAAAADFVFACLVTPRAELFPGMLDQASRDPKHPACKIYASVGRINLALCTNSYTPVGEKELELFNRRFPYCWYGSGAWRQMMRSCPDGEMVEAIRPYNEEGLLLRIYRNQDRP